MQAPQKIKMLDLKKHYRKGVVPFLDVCFCDSCFSLSKAVFSRYWQDDASYHPSIILRFIKFFLDSSYDMHV